MPGVERAAVVGVDAGGTWIRVLVEPDSGRRRAWRTRAASGGDLAGVLGTAWRRLRLKPANVRALVVATRGVWTGRERSAAARRLRPLARRVRVISDVEAAYRGALGEGGGVLVLAGTGSIALAGDGRGRFARAGGLGPLLGEPGSAFSIGRASLATSARAGDDLRARRLACAPDAVARVAAQAPRVLRRARAGDRQARAIVTRAQADLAELGLTAARRLGLRAPIRVSWAGRLMGDARFRAGVWRAMRRAGVSLRVRAPHESALHAAARLARATEASD